jgi:hypothetical protein
MKTFNHLIAQHGVLISFSIAKKLNRDSIKSISDEINKLGGDKKTRNQLLEEEIKRNTMDSMKLTDVPGLIMSKTEIVKEKFMDNSFMKDEKKVISLMILSNLLSKKILDKKLPKEQMCFILISMINSLGLSDGDFKNFHQKHNPNYMHDEDEDDIDDFEDEEDDEYGDDDEF